MKQAVFALLFAALLFQSLVLPVRAEMIDLSASASAVATPPATIQYDLPYPGILPDNPLYFLKVIRDRVVGFLINDPQKRAEFNLLQSDKKLFAAEMLFDKQKNNMAIDTISKSNNYMHTAVSEIQKAKKSGREVLGLAGNIHTSIDKHEQDLANLAQAHPQQRQELNGELKRLKDIEKFFDQTFPQK